MQAETTYWRKCSSCKKPIGFRALYWVCNVSTCNRKRTGLVFCSVSCWDAHVPLMNHRDSWALEKPAPATAEAADDGADESNEGKQTMENQNEGGNAGGGESGGEVLVVASKLKNYIKAKSGMNTSGAVLDALSSKLRQMCDQAIENAKREGRKTVMDRDFG